MKSRCPRTLRLGMCKPTYFDVVYSVNPWMDMNVPVDLNLASRQWEALYESLLALGHEVTLIDPMPGQPDMVFTANAGVVCGERAMSAKFRAPFRNPETPVYHRWLEGLGFQVRAPAHVSEGEGDFTPFPSGGVVFAGDGVRTTAVAHEEMASHLAMPVVPLTLVDERFYHLDTAFSILDSETALYYPPAFSKRSCAVLSDYFRDLIAVTEADALVLGANAVSDGLNVFLEAEAESLASALAALGFRPVRLAMSEFRKSGGAVRCCVLEFFPESEDRSVTATSSERVGEMMRRTVDLPGE